MEQKPTQTIQANLLNTNLQLSLDVINGISMPSGDFQNFASDGFNSGIQINKSFCKALSIGFGARHSSFGVRQEFGPVSSSRNRWINTTIDVGPQYSISTGIFALKLYGRSGVSIISTPEINLYYPNTDILTTQIQSRSTQALSTRLGGKLNAEICNGLQFFLSGEYVTTINSNLTYSSREVSTDGTIDLEEGLRKNPLTNKNLSFSSVNVNFGISIGLGNFGSKAKTKRNSNPMYQDNENKGTMPMYNESSTQGNGSNSSGTRAQDYNSSRSNNSSVIAPNPNNTNTDIKATDYNSSRSNRTTNSTLKDTNEIKPTKTQDYNSSRSNNSSVIAPNPNNTETDIKATDYNSSRSNRTTSNTLTNTAENTNKNNSTKAQDYNSSRSNNSSVIANNPNDDIRQTMTHSDKAKLKRKLKRKERQKRKEARKKRHYPTK
ncbi:hypothetical protein [Ancylomarina longa]|uniref:Uncharacterized protein n=1 Tax=Ancylomarina longa TaxID=2487017 RepID=A0A434AXJ8_9BACT|nr:hypothetical protein [Ancylomarina longa]RUT79140.1 hypothetical protein DLK05_04805 [Ancylomarina longa]